MIRREDSADFVHQNARQNVEIRIQELESGRETSRRKAGLNARAAAFSTGAGLLFNFMPHGASLEGQMGLELGTLGLLGFAAFQILLYMERKIEQEQALKLLVAYQDIARQLDAPEDVEAQHDGRA